MSLFERSAESGHRCDHSLQPLQIWVHQCGSSNAWQRWKMGATWGDLLWGRVGGSAVGGSIGGPLWQSHRKPLKGHVPVPCIAQKCSGSIFWKIRHKTTEYRLNPVRRKINKKYLFNKAPDLDCLLSRTIWSNLSPGATICVCIRFYHSQCTCPYLILLEPSPNLSR